MAATPKTRRTRRIPIAFICLLTAGCVYDNPDYPPDWSAPSPRGDRCQAIAGKYVNEGEAEKDAASGYTPYGPFLDTYVLDEQGRRSAGPNHRSIDHMELAFDKQRALHVRAFEGERPVAESIYSEENGSLHCTTRGAEIKSYHGRSHGVGNPVAGYEYESMELIKGGDGALVIKRSGGGFGLVFMLIPAGTSETHWVRFPTVP